MLAQHCQEHTYAMEDPFVFVCELLQILLQLCENLMRGTDKGIDGLPRGAHMALVRDRQAAVQALL